MKLELEVFDIASSRTNNIPISSRATQLGSQAVAQVELPLFELARSRRLFYGGTQLAANAVAPDTALPTTTIKLGLFNGEPDDGKCLVIDKIHHFLVSGTAAAGSTLWACISGSKLATPVTAMATGFNVQSASGRGSSAAKFGTALTFPTGTVWHSLGSSFQLAAANIGQGDQPVEVRGGLVIPPGYALGLAIFSGAGTTPLYGHSLTWAEVESSVMT